MTPPASTAVQPNRPEIATDRYPEPRPRWTELATSAAHKDIGRMLITGALGFLFIAAIELLLMRLQLSIPENTFLDPVTFNRLLSIYGSTAILLFALPLALGFFYYVVPLQIGARSTALPRLGQTGLWLFIAGATVLYSSFLFTPTEAGVNPLSPLTEKVFLPNNGVDAWAASTGLILLGFIFLSIDLLTTIRNNRAPGMAWRRVPVFSWAAAISSWLIIFIGPVMIGAVTMLIIDRHFNGIFFAGESGGSPLLWQHLSWIFFSGAYMLILIFSFGALSEIIPAFARRPLCNRNVVIGSLAALAPLGVLAWLQNMLTAPISIGWMYFGMLFALATIIPFGLIIFNLLATLFGGSIRMRAPMLYAAGAISVISVGLASEIGHSMVAVAWQLKDTTDSTAATHYALVGGAVFAGFAALHFWFPKMTGRTMGESLSRMSFWTMFVGANLAFFPLFLAGVQGEVADTYKFFGSTGVTLYNLLASIGTFVLVVGVIMTLINAVLSITGGPRAGHDPWGGESLEWFAPSPPPVHNFDVLPDVRSNQPLRDIRDAVARRTGETSEDAGETQPVA